MKYALKEMLMLLFLLLMEYFDDFIVKCIYLKNQSILKKAQNINQVIVLGISILQTITSQGSMSKGNSNYLLILYYLMARSFLELHAKVNAITIVRRRYRRGLLSSAYPKNLIFFNLREHLTVEGKQFNY